MFRRISNPLTISTRKRKEDSRYNAVLWNKNDKKCSCARNAEKDVLYPVKETKIEECIFVGKGGKWMMFCCTYFSDTVILKGWFGQKSDVSKIGYVKADGLGETLLFTRTKSDKN